MAAGSPTERRQPLEVSLREHGALFQRRFGDSAGLRTFVSPGRVNLLGAHLDYSGGPVMPMAIDRGTFIAVRAREDGVLRMESTLEGKSFEGDLEALPAEPGGSWYDYPIGVVRRLRQERSQVRGADILFGGNLPIGAGLSSSASICVGTAHALCRVSDIEPEPELCIRAALWAEREFVGVKCGIMDPYAVALTRPEHLLWLDCKDASVEHLPLDTARPLDRRGGLRRSSRARARRLQRTRAASARRPSSTCAVSFRERNVCATSRSRSSRRTVTSLEPGHVASAHGTWRPRWSGPSPLVPRS